MEETEGQRETLFRILRDMRIDRERKQNETDMKIKINHGLCYWRLNFSSGWKHPELRDCRNMYLFHWISFSVFCLCAYPAFIS